MLRTCIDCKHSHIKHDGWSGKILYIYCNFIRKEIPIKRYNKMNFCLYHERKGDL